MGRSRPPQVPTIAPPPVQEILDIIDEVNGTQFITVTGPDGKKRRKIERLPRIAEEEEKYRLGGDLFKKAVTNIQELYKYDPSLVADYEPFIKTIADLSDERRQGLQRVRNIGDIDREVEAFRTIQNRNLEDKIRIQNRQMEENLAHRGISNSYAANEARAFADRNAEAMRQDVDFQAGIFGEDMAGRRLSRNKEIFGLEELDRQARLDAAQLGYDLQKDKNAQLETMRQGAINENMNTLNIANTLLGQDQAKAMNSIAPQLAVQDFSARASDSLGRHQAHTSAQFAAYDRAYKAYQDRPMSFQNFALQTGGKLAGRYFGGS